MEEVSSRRQKWSSQMVPDFDNDLGVLAKDYWGDWMRMLAKENTDRVESVAEEFMDYLTTESVEYIFTVCVRLRLPHETRYIAALLFEEFMRKLTLDLFRFIADQKISQRKKDSEWAKIETNLSRQVPLRVVSCIQIASKDTQFHTSLSSVDVVSILRTLGYAYTQSAILKSEVRILTTLEFRVPKTPVIYPESLLKCLCEHSLDDLGLSEPLNYSSIWDHVLLFLDQFFLYHDKYASTAISTAVPNRDAGSFSRKAVAALKADFMLLGAGLVSASIAVVHSFSAVDHIIPILSQLTKGVPASDISEVSVSMIQMTKTLAEEKKNPPARKPAPSKETSNASSRFF